MATSQKKFIKIFLTFSCLYTYLLVSCKRFKLKKNSMRQLTNMLSFSNQPNWNEQPMSYSLGDINHG
jgi:hypothetical protein